VAGPTPGGAGPLRLLAVARKMGVRVPVYASSSKRGETSLL